MNWHISWRKHEKEAYRIHERERPNLVLSEVPSLGAVVLPSLRSGRWVQSSSRDCTLALTGTTSICTATQNQAKRQLLTSNERQVRPLIQLVAVTIAWTRDTGTFSGYSMLSLFNSLPCGVLLCGLRKGSNVQRSMKPSIPRPFQKQWIFATGIAVIWTSN